MDNVIIYTISNAYIGVAMHLNVCLYVHAYVLMRITNERLETVRRHCDRLLQSSNKQSLQFVMILGMS